MKRLNLYENNPQTVNGTIQQIQQVLDTTREGTVLRTVDGETEALISPDGNIYVNGEPIGSGGGGTAITGMTDNAIVRGDGTSDIQNSALKIDDVGNITSTANSLGVTLADTSSMTLNSTGLTVNGTLLTPGDGVVTAESYVVLDRTELNGKTVAADIDRIYCQYYDRNHKDAFNPEASGPHVSGHWLRRHVMSGTGSDAQRLAAGWGDAQNGQYWLQTDVNPYCVWWWLSNTAQADEPVWFSFGRIGYSWTTSNGGTVYWCVDEIEPNALQCGALNGNLNETDDTLALQSLAAFFNAGRNVFLPSGYYWISSPLTLMTAGANVFRGEGGVNTSRATQIATRGAINAIEIYATVQSGCFSGSLRDFTVWGGLDGIHSTLTNQDLCIRYTEWSEVGAIAPRHGFYIPGCYSFTMRGCLGLSTSDGNGFSVAAGVGTLFLQCQGGSTGPMTAAFRVSKAATFVACNTAITIWSEPGAPFCFLLGNFPSVNSTTANRATNTITLNASSNFVTDQIVARDIVITSGTGTGQRRRITAYNSSTKVATITPNWTTLPAIGSTYTIEEPVDFMRQVDVYAQPFTLVNCNCENFTKTGIRTQGDTLLTVLGGSFYSTSSYECAIRIAKDVSDSAVSIINPLMNNYSGTAAAPIVTEGTPYVLNNPGPNECYDVVSNKVHKWGDGTSCLIANLPAGVAQGSRAFVTNANTPNFNDVAATGANSWTFPVWYDGYNWRIG